MNILIAKSTAMNCTINIDEELNYIELFKNILDLAGSQRSQTESEELQKANFRIVISKIMLSWTFTVFFLQYHYT